MSELVLVVGVFALCVLCAGVGAATGIAVYFGGERGERKRFEGELAPLRASISEVADRFDHWTKRERRRDAVGGPRTNEQPATEGSPLTRRDVIRGIAKQFEGR